METKHIILGLLEALLVTIEKPERNLWIAAAVLLALFYLGFVLCPWVRHTRAWQGL